MTGRRDRQHAVSSIDRVRRILAPSSSRFQDSLCMGSNILEQMTLPCHAKSTKRCPLVCDGRRARQKLPRLEQSASDQFFAVLVIIPFIDSTVTLMRSGSCMASTSAKFEGQGVIPGPRTPIAHYLRVLIAFACSRIDPPRHCLMWAQSIESACILNTAQSTSMCWRPSRDTRSPIHHRGCKMPRLHPHQNRTGLVSDMLERCIWAASEAFR